MSHFINFFDKNLKSCHNYRYSGNYGDIMPQDNPFYIELAQTIQKHRKIAGLTQQQLALFAGVGKTVIHDIEHGKETVRLDTLYKVCQTLNIQITFKSPLLRSGVENATR